MGHDECPAPGDHSEITEELKRLQEDVIRLRHRIDRAAAEDRRVAQLPFPGPERRSVLRRASDRELADR